MAKGAAMNKILRKLGVLALKRAGYSPYTANELFNKWYDDFFNYKKTTLTQKLWAYRRGFKSYEIPYYGLTEENYKDFVPGFDYLCLYPINGSYSHWIDDKLTTKYLLYPFSEYLPDYYFHIYCGEILRLVDCPEGFEASVQGIIGLLKARGSLAVKLTVGSYAIGFHKLAYENGSCYFNGQVTSEKELENLISRWLETENSQYLITEFLQAHSDLRKYWAEAPCTLRLMVKREKHQSPVIMLSFVHFATKQSGVRNVPYGISCIVDVNTGFFSDGQDRRPTELVKCKYHPDTNMLLEGKLPHWELITEKIIAISSYLPQLRYMGYDIIVTDDGFKIIEINSHSSIDYFQAYQPLLAGELTGDFFRGLLEEKKHR